MERTVTTHTKGYPTLKTVVFWATLIIINAIPWALGGQHLEVELTIFFVSLITFIVQLGSGMDHESKWLIAILGCLAIYIVAQFLNPSLIQEWQQGLRIWKLKAVDNISWLPTSVSSNFSDASPLRSLVSYTTIVCLTTIVSLHYKKPSIGTFLLIVGINAMLIASIGLIQNAIGSQKILGSFSAVEEGFGLFFGTFLYKNHAAGYLNLGLAVCLTGYIKSIQNMPERAGSNPSWMFLILATVIFVGIVFTRSRFGFICSIFLTTVFTLISATILISKGNSTTKTFASYVVALLLLTPGVIYLLRSPSAAHLESIKGGIVEDFSIKQRLLAYESGLHMFSAKPIYGWGAGNFRHGFRLFQDLERENHETNNPNLERREKNYFWQHAHNDYLEWLIELGVVGTLILFSIPGYFFWRIFKSSRWKEPVPLMLLAGLASTMIHALVDFPFQNPAVLVTWFAILAITTNYCDREKDQRRPPAAGSGRVSIR